MIMQKRSFPSEATKFTCRNKRRVHKIVSPDQPLRYLSGQGIMKKKLHLMLYNYSNHNWKYVCRSRTDKQQWPNVQYKRCMQDYLKNDLVHVK